MMSEFDCFPDHVLDELARMLYPALLAFYEDEANQQAFMEWQAKRQSSSA